MTDHREYRVLLVDLARSFGGAEIRVLSQARALRERVASVHVAALHGSLLHQHLEAEGLPSIPIQAGRASPKLLWDLGRIIRHYDIVDAHNVQSILWSHLAASLVRVHGRVATIHSDYGAEYPGFKGRLYEGVLRLDRRLGRQIINVTGVLQSKAERQGLGARSTLIYNAVAVPDDPAAGVPNVELRRELGFGPDDFVVASFARLKPVKGHTYLIDGLARLKDLPHVKLLLVGDGPLRAELEAQAEALGIADRVRFTGFRRDITALLLAVNAACLASLSEALPYAVLEAASYARPLLVTKVGGMADLLDNGVNALLVPPRDPAALADGMRWLATRPEDACELGLAAYKLVRDSFSLDVMIEQVLQVYDRALL